MEGPVGEVRSELRLVRTRHGIGLGSAHDGGWLAELGGVAGVLGCCLLLAAGVLSQPLRAQPAATLPCALEPGPSRAVGHVIDGETVRLDDAVEVRLVGALAPRASDSGAEATGNWPPAEEARTALAELVLGRSVALAFAGPRNDRYGRVLAHAFVNSAAGDIWVQGRLVERGHARAYALPESAACLAALVERERRARADGLGLWSHAAYQIRPADRPTELQRYRHTFQLVRGRIENGRSTRQLAILELASGERAASDGGAGQAGAFRVVWPRRLAKQAGLERPERLVGRNVLVRGWIDGPRAPEIALSTAAELELED